MAGIGINLGYLLVHILNFLIMMLILGALVYRPVLTALQNRRMKIAQGLEDARIAAEARANAEKEANQIINDAQAKSAQIVRDAMERADIAAREVKETAEKDVSREREIAMAEVNRERERMLSDLRGQVASLSMAAAQKLIGEALDDQRQHALIDQFFSGIRAGKVIVLEGAQMEGGSAEVTSALALTPEEKETIRKEILSKIGQQATVTFRVDPTILGGLVVQAGDRVWNASVAGQLGSMRHNMI